MQSAGMMTGTYAAGGGAELPPGDDPGRRARSRKKQAYGIGLLLLGCMIVGTFASITLSGPEESAEQQYGSGAWMNSTYQYRIHLKIENTNAGENLPAGYPVSVSVEYPSLVAGGMMRGDYNDVRIAYEHDGAAVELPRGSATHVNATQITVYFRLQADISPGQSSYAYYVYYGCWDASAPPVDSFSVIPPKDMSPSVGFMAQEKVPEFAPAATALAGAACLVTFAFVAKSLRRN